MLIKWADNFNLNTNKIILGFIGMFLLYNLFEGFFRYLLFSSGLSFAVYSLKLIMVLFILLKVSPYIKKTTLITFFVILWYLLLGVYQNGLYSAIISLFVLFPLIFFYLYPPNYILESLSVKFLIFLLGGVFLGILADFYYELPWVGYSSIVDGNSVTSGKEWWVDGKERLAGFGRSSVETATMLSFIAITLGSKIKFNLTYAIAYITSFIGVYLTTTKGALVALLISAVYNLIPKKLSPLKSIVFLSSVIFGNAILLLSVFQINVDFLYDVYFSLYERVVYMWPTTIELLNEGNRWFGLGFGGVGLAKDIAFSAVDNFWLYIISMFGLVVWLIVFTLSLLSYKQIVKLKFSSFYIFFFIYGITNNMVESIFGQVILAMFLVDLINLIQNREVDHYVAN